MVAVTDANGERYCPGCGRYVDFEDLERGKCKFCGRITYYPENPMEVGKMGEKPKYTTENGALWEKVSKNGKKYLEGHVDINKYVSIRLVFFENTPNTNLQAQEARKEIQVTEQLVGRQN